MWYISVWGLKTYCRPVVEILGYFNHIDCCKLQFCDAFVWIWIRVRCLESVKCAAHWNQFVCTPAVYIYVYIIKQMCTRPTRVTCINDKNYNAICTWFYIFMKFSGCWHKKKLARLFHAWLDCFALLKLGTAKVRALGVLLAQGLCL